VRHELAERLRLRKPPELYFQIDRADQLEVEWMSCWAREKTGAEAAEPSLKAVLVVSKTQGASC